MVLIANIPYGDNYYKFISPQPPLEQPNDGITSLKFLAMVEVELTWKKTTVFLDFLMQLLLGLKPNVSNHANHISRQHQETTKIKTKRKFNSRARLTVLSRTCPLKYPLLKPKFSPQYFLSWNETHNFLLCVDFFRSFNTLPPFLFVASKSVQRVDARPPQIP
jgi:hypothetical protein